MLFTMQSDILRRDRLLVSAVPCHKPNGGHEQAVPAESQRGENKMNSTPGEIPLTARPRLSKLARLQWDPVREKQVILMPEGVLALNATAAAIVALCDGQRSVSVIISTLSEQYKQVIDQDVLTFLQRLANKRLLDIGDE
jgi:pyrroloquinoline quinone biosynthesis protein D